MKKALLPVLFLSLIIISLVSFYRFALKGVLKARPNIVLISIDTLRGDRFCPEHMPLTYGWAKENCIIYENAYSDSTWTRPSYATLLTGLPPIEHGVEYLDSVLSPDIPTIPARIKELGYKSYAFTNSGHVSKHSGFDKNFDFWIEINNAAQENYFARFLEPFEKSKDKLANPESNPVFVFIHTYYVHEYPYKDSDVTAEMLGDLKKWNAFRTEKVHSLKELDKKELAAQMYTEKVEEFDKHLFDYIQWLMNSALSDNLKIIVTADHGEALHEEYGNKIIFGHTGPPYPENIKIPFFIYGFGAGSVDDMVSVKDITDFVYAFAKKHGVYSPDNPVIRSEYYTRKREKDDKLRSVTIVEKDGTWNMRSYADKTKADESEDRAVSKEHLDQLRALGYLN